jgi:hypothetical protein
LTWKWKWKWKWKSLRWAVHKIHWWTKDRTWQMSLHGNTMGSKRNKPSAKTAVLATSNLCVGVYYVGVTIILRPTSYIKHIHMVTLLRKQHNQFLCTHIRWFILD